MDAITPLKYFGQRREIIEEIFPAIKASGQINHFYDLFSGSGSVSFYAMSQGIANSYQLNDSYIVLKKLWEAILQKPKEVIEKFATYENLILSDSHASKIYTQLLRQYNHSLEQKELAYLLPILLNHSQNHIPLFNQGELVLTPSAKFFKQHRYFEEQVMKLHRLLKNSNPCFHATHFFDLILKVQPNDFVFLDPPYPQQNENIYFNLCPTHKLKHELESGMTVLNKINVPFILFYGVNDLPEVWQFSEEKYQLKHFVRFSVQTESTMYYEHLYFSNFIPFNFSELPAHFCAYKDLHTSPYIKKIQEVSVSI